HVNLGVACTTGVVGSINKAYATVGGGRFNTASGTGSTVGGGESNTTSDWYSSVGGGLDNEASGLVSTIGGGSENSNAGDHSTIAGGYADTISATADYSYLFGIGSKLTEDSTFMVDMPHIRLGDEATGYEIPSSRGTVDQVLQTDGSGQVSWATVSSGGDDLGDHTATQNVELSDNWLSNDGDSEGLFVDTDGDVGVGTNTPDARLHIVGQTIIDGSTLEFVNTGSSVFIGEDAGANDDYTTNSNTGIGNIALRDNISGFFNTAVGSGALANNLEDHNTAFGMSSLLYNTSGGENTGIGRAALQSNTTGDNNTGLGFWTDVGSNNLTNATAIGAYAYVTQSNSLILGSINGVNTATADTKVGIGTTSPYYKFEVQGATGSNNWIAKINNISNDNTTYNNGLLIQAGHDSYNSSRGSNMLTFSRPDGAPMGAVIQNGSTSISYYSISDRRQKSNIRTTDYGLNNLLQIQVADYEYKDNSATTQTGFIAQQLYEHYPEAVSVGGDDLEANPWMVAYGKMTPLLVKAVQEQQETIEELKAEVEELKKMVQQLAGQ
ncbi:tail fiber domain-containing protein, partial [Neptuniibacter sp.]|uniref:tail fiber domain-containing protein n=1 Tax=Neptuniibacter sp. TaxID=1962643 RepID=UPI00260B4A35